MIANLIEPKGFTSLIPFAPPASAPVVAKRKNTLRHTSRLVEFLIDTLDLNAERVREALSAWGEPLEGTDLLHPKAVAQSTLSHWLAGRSEIPKFRLAQLVMLIESAMVDKRAEDRTRLEPDDPTFSIYDTVERIIQSLESDEELRLTTDRYRVTLRRLLGEQAKNGPEEAIRYERYAQHLHEIGIGSKVGERKATAKGEKHSGKKTPPA